MTPRRVSPSAFLFSFSVLTSNGVCAMTIRLKRPRPLSCDDSSSSQGIMWSYFWRLAFYDALKVYGGKEKRPSRWWCIVWRLVFIFISYSVKISVNFSLSLDRTNRTAEGILRKFTKARLGVNCLQLSAYSLCHFLSHRKTFYTNCVIAQLGRYRIKKEINYLIYY